MRVRVGGRRAACGARAAGWPRAAAVAGRAHFAAAALRAARAAHYPPHCAAAARLEQAGERGPLEIL